ncbi:MAG: TIGR04076 family protein [Chloroflexi bacterium]|nr:TIGR04076 family protein [Chloroflexota bacterium]
MTEPKTLPVKITVKTVTRGECPLKMKPGDSWVFQRQTPEGMCMAAFSALMPAMRTFIVPGAVYRYPGDAPEGEVVEVSCPDPKHWVIYEVRRLAE